mgnify:CR=1 FL=1
MPCKIKAHPYPKQRKRIRSIRSREVVKVKYINKNFSSKITNETKKIAEDIISKTLDMYNVSLEDFISIKGITALGNQLTKYKLIEINPKEPLRHEPTGETPLEELEVIEEINVTVSDKKD